MITNFEQLTEAHILWVAPYSLKDGIDSIILHDITIDTIVKSLIISRIETRRLRGLSILGARLGYDPENW